jgi:hypothetical protein
MRVLSPMSLLNQINLVYDVARNRGLQAPLYFKGLTYDRISQQFEKPHDALANRHRNPIARVCERILRFCKLLVRPFHRVGRIEIVIRIKPEI